MMRADAFNLQVYTVRIEMTYMKQILILYVCSTDERKLKYFLVDETLSQICSTDKDESKVIVVNECSMEEYES